MKNFVKIISLACFFLFAIETKAQNIPKILNPNGQEMHVGVKNPLNIDLKLFQATEIRLEVVNARLIEKEGKYWLEVLQVGEEVHVKLFIENEKMKYMADEKRFKISIMPDMKFTINIDFTDRAALTKIQDFGLYYTFFSKELYEIRAFKVGIETGKILRVFENKSREMNEEIIKEIDSALIGDKIKIFDIQYISKETTVLLQSPEVLEFVIK